MESSTHQHLPSSALQWTKIQILWDANQNFYLQTLPDDLKTKLSIDDDIASSPREALSRASADRIALRNRHLKT